MANLFAGLDTPKYLGPEERSLAAARGAGDFGQQFGAAFRQAREMREARNDPLLKLKAAALQTQASEVASRLADSELSRRMKQNQIDSEAADKLAFTNLVTEAQGDDDKFLEGLGRTFFASPIGKDMATQARLATVARKSRDAFSKALAKLTPQGIARVSRFDPGSSEAWDAVEVEAQAQSKNIMPESFELSVGGRPVFGIRNPATGSFELLDPNKLAPTELIEFRQLVEDRSAVETEMAARKDPERRKLFQSRIDEINGKIKSLIHKEPTTPNGSSATPEGPKDPLGLFR